MKFSPIDANEIKGHAFKNVIFGGYKKDDVSDFLEELATQWMDLDSHNADLERRLASAREDLNNLRDIEATLLKSLSQAQKANEVTVEQAKKKADILLLRGQMRADAIIQEAEQKAKEMVSEAKALSDETLHSMRSELGQMTEAYKAVSEERDRIVSETHDYLAQTMEHLNKLAAKSRFNPDFTAELERAEKLLSKNQQTLDAHQNTAFREGIKLPEFSDDVRKEALKPEGKSQRGRISFKADNTKPKAQKPSSSPAGDDTSFFDDIF